MSNQRLSSLFHSGRCAKSGCQYFCLLSALGEALTPFQQFGNVPGSSPMCGKAITITYNGKTANAVVDDKVNFLCHPVLLAPCVSSLPPQCPVCPFGGLDLTEGLFNFLAGGLGAGVIYADWTVGGGGGDAPARTTSSPPPPPPSPTTHYVPPTTHQEPTSSPPPPSRDRKSTRLNSSHGYISYAVFCLKKKTKERQQDSELKIKPREQ